jgi:hypothetical protein
VAKAGLLHKEPRKRGKWLGNEGVRPWGDLRNQQRTIYQTLVGGAAMRGKPLAIDLFCGLGGWTEGLLAEGYAVIGFDIEQHVYGDHRYPAQLVVQDVLTLHGSQFRSADLIVASPPCQEYSYMAMPWQKAKAKAAAIRADDTGAKLADLNLLFDACFRIQREACAAAGRRIPLIVENVKGAQPWVGRSQWNYGSFHLWGDIPALMPAAIRAGRKSTGMNWSDPAKRGQDFTRIAGDQAIKNNGGSWFNVAHNTTSGKGQNPDGRKQGGSGAAWSDKALDERRRAATATKNGNDWFGAGDKCSLQRRYGSKSSGRKFASALIAKIPLTLSRHIAATYRPTPTTRAILASMEAHDG